MRDYPEGGEFDPAVDDRRRCKKKYPSALSCMSKKNLKGLVWR